VCIITIYGEILRIWYDVTISTKTDDIFIVMDEYIPLLDNIENLPWLEFRDASGVLWEIKTKRICVVKIEKKNSSKSPIVKCIDDSFF
jgi:hypothetical protein